MSVKFPKGAIVKFTDEFLASQDNIRANSRTRLKSEYSEGDNLNALRCTVLFDPGDLYWYVRGRDNQFVFPAAYILELADDVITTQSRRLTVRRNGE